MLPADKAAFTCPVEIQDQTVDGCPDTTNHQSAIALSGNFLQATIHGGSSAIGVIEFNQPVE